MNVLTQAYVVSSPSKRALETARMATQEAVLDIVQDTDLCEIDFGRWEGMSFNEITHNDPDLVDQWALGNLDFSFPEGESLATFRNRVRRVGQRLRERPEDTIIVVTHGGVIRFLLCYFLDLDHRLHLMFEISHGSITRIQLHDDKAVLLGLNDRCHLEDI